MTEGEIQYTRNGEYHIAYGSRAKAPAAVDVLLHRGVRLQPRPPAPAAVRSAASELAATRTADLASTAAAWASPTACATTACRRIEERMDDADRAVLDAAGAERALLVAGADGGPLACLLAATLPGADTRGRADEHRAALRLGARLSLGGAERRVRATTRGRWSRAGARRRTPRSTRPWPIRA